MWKGEEKERDRRMRMNVEGRREGKRPKDEDECGREKRRKETEG